MSEIFERVLHLLPYVIVGNLAGKGLAKLWFWWSDRKHDR